MKVKIKCDLLEKLINNRNNKFRNVNKENKLVNKCNVELVEKKRRRQKSRKEAENGEEIESHKNKEWKRKGSKITISEFLNNIFFNKRKIKFNYYVLLFAMIFLCFSSIYLAKNTYEASVSEEYITLSAFSKNENSENNNLNDENNVSYEQTEEEEMTIVKQRKDFESIDVEKQNIEEVETKVENVKNIITSNTQEKKIEFSEPIKNGKIQKIYSSDKLIYSKTLDMWKIHEGIDISASIGQVVYAVEAGKILKIYDDSFLGKTIVIEHIEGYLSCYSNLGENIYVKVGDSVKKSQKIGEVGNSSIGEINDAPHLHFMLYKDNQLIDPSSIFYKQ